MLPTRMHPRHFTIALTALLATAMLAPPALARIKLITLPVRDRVEVRLDHADATLVEEQRVVPLVKGVNQVDFSWSNTPINAGTIVFRVVKADFDVKVLSVSYPPNENALVWQVSAADSGSATVRISYLLGNLDKTFSYRAVAAPDEATLTLRQYVRVRNLANEAFEGSDIHLGFGPTFTKSIGLNETKEVLVQKVEQVPVKKTYTVNPVALGYIDRPQNKLRVPMHYVLKNSEDHKLGTTLPYGKVRIFQQDNSGGSAFLGEDWGQQTPVGDEMKLAIGVARDITVKRVIEDIERTRVSGNLFNYDVVVKYEIENFKDQPVTLDVVEPLPNLRGEAGIGSNRQVQWELGDKTSFEGGLDRKETTLNQAVLHADLPARIGDEAEKVTLRLHIRILNEW